MPFQGLEAPAEIRHKRTAYPGSSTASIQVLGVDEAPIQVNGRFSDTLTGRPGGALAKLKELRAVFLGFQLCELSWGETLVRRGLIRRLRPTFNRDSDIGYRFEFEVTEADEPEARRQTDTSATTIATMRSIFDRAAGRVGDAAEAITDALGIPGLF